MRRILVRLTGEGRSYPVFLGSGAMESVARELKLRPVGERYAVVTDRTVRKLYGQRLVSDLDWAGTPTRAFSFPPGERSKTLATVETLARRLLRAGFSRSDAIIALGGGVVGDVAGTLAATYMRGIPFVQVPTTLLAMVDSSIGGKVAVDLPEGKNVLGQFWQPSMVFVDPDCLETLPVRHRRSGWVEVVKHAVIADANHFGWLERRRRGLLRLKPPAMEEVLATSLRIKSRVVRKDEREADARRMLNYGHSVGHALEVLTGYRKFTHGEAVAMGMSVEGRVARRLGLWEERDRKRQDRLLQALGLDLDLPPLSPRDLLRTLGRDKKAVHGTIILALPRRIGAMKTLKGKFGLPTERRVILEAIREKLHEARVQEGPASSRREG